MKRSFGARAVACILPAFVVGTYDHKGKPDARVAAWGGICSSDRQVLQFRCALPVIPTRT
jgi:hypothetical protein